MSIWPASDVYLMKRGCSFRTIKELPGQPFEAPDAKPVGLLFFVLVPEKATDTHLQILASLAEMFADAQMREQLTTLPTPDAVHRALTNFHADAAPYAQSAV